MTALDRRSSLLPQVISPADSRVELARLGIELSVLTEALQAGEVGAGGVSVGHPSNAPGMLRWMETVARLRNQLLAAGWRATDPKGAPRITSADGRVSIMVAGGDAATGSEEPVHPRFAHPKGVATGDSVAGNQMVLPFPLTPPPTVSASPIGGNGTWVLLYFRSTNPSEIRAELSFPTRFVGGDVDNWRVRIILPSIPIEAVSVPQIAGGAGDDVQFEIPNR